MSRGGVAPLPLTPRAGWERRRDRRPSSRGEGRAGSCPVARGTRPGTSDGHRRYRAAPWAGHKPGLVPFVPQRACLGHEFSNQLGRQPGDPAVAEDRCTLRAPHRTAVLDDHESSVDVRLRRPACSPCGRGPVRRDAAGSGAGITPCLGMSVASLSKKGEMSNRFVGIPELTDVPRVAVVDVMRAFTVAAWAFSRGTERIVLAAPEDEALALKESPPGWPALKDGAPEAGFDAVNSPAPIRSFDLAGRTVAQKKAAGAVGAPAVASAPQVLLAMATSSGRLSGSAASRCGVRQLTRCSLA